MQTSDVCNMDYIKAIRDLKDHAEHNAERLRYAAITLASIALLGFLAIGAFAGYYEPQSREAITWAIVRLSAWLTKAALLLFFSRVIWNYSNVWLGRAGTLEDLALALKLLG